MLRLLHEHVAGHSACLVRQPMLGVVVQSMTETMRIVSEAMTSQMRHMLKLDSDDFIDDAIDMDQREQQQSQPDTRPIWPLH